MKSSLGREGIGGWLGILILSLIVFSPLHALNVYSTMEDATQRFHLNTYPQWRTFSSGMAWMMGVASAIKIIAGIRLLTYKKRSSVRFAIAALWISDLGGMIAGFVLRSSILPETAGTIMQELNGPTMISLCTVGIWTAYLLRSKRVSNTYIR